MSLLQDPVDDFPPPIEDPSKCSLLGSTGIIVQALMGAFVILSLVVKRQLEKQKRPWRIWLWDVSKQCAGQAVVHGLNLLISDQVALAAHNNPCSLYFLNVLIDTTIGVGIFYLALQGWTWLFAVHFQLEGFESGRYGNPPKPTYWWRQLAPYLLSIIVMKLLVLLPLTLPYISDGLIHMGHVLLGWLSPSVQIIFVMALFPLVMNIVQFCIVDQVIKAGQSNKDLNMDDEESGYHAVPTREADGDLTRGRSSSRESRHRHLKSSRQSSPLSTPRLPKSPLMVPAVDTPVNHDYGSTSTSPSPAGEATSVWVKMAKRRNSSDTDLTSDLATERLSVGRESRRSGAPSPDSAIGKTPDGRRNGLESVGVSRLSDEIGRTARRTLSPEAAGSRFRGAKERGSAVTLDELGDED